MKLYSNGCSYTWGGTLFSIKYTDDSGNYYYLPRDKDCEQNKKRLETVYPHHLGKLLNAAEVINDSMGGGSNDRIVRTTLDYFTNAKLKGQDLTDYFVTIQWTEPNRTEIYDDFFDHSYVGIMTNGLCSENPQDGSYIHHEKVNKLYYKYFSNNVNDYNRLIKNIYSVGYFLRYHKIPHLFFSLGQLFSTWIEPEAQDVSRRVQLLDHYNSLMNDFTWFIDANQSMTTVMTFEDCMPEGTHPNAKGHQQIAQTLYDYINQHNLISK